jgi:hypothetical protein
MMQAALLVILTHQGAVAAAAAAPLAGGSGNGSSSVLQLSLSRQVPASSSADFDWEARITRAEWRAEETALVLIDLWNCHVPLVRRDGARGASHCVCVMRGTYADTRE